jgi:hypothetical protein
LPNTLPSRTLQDAAPTSNDLISTACLIMPLYWRTMVPALFLARVAWTLQPVKICPRHGRIKLATHAGKTPSYRGDKSAENGDNRGNRAIRILGKSSVVVSCRPALLVVAVAACVVLQPLRAHAQWWSRAPADFEECADKAEKAATKEERSSKLTECNAKFAGRRKPGGGYTYFDFMQNRSFDIAGPNPTPEEQKQIDEHYTAFLDRERQSRIAAALAAKQQQQQQLQLKQASLKKIERVPVPVEAPNKPQAAASDLRSRAKATNCARHSFSCDWPRLSESLKDLKKLFGPSSSKAKRS